MSFVHLEKAFALAHKASEDAELPLKTRLLFSQIALEIWLACGNKPELVNGVSNGK